MSVMDCFSTRLKLLREDSCLSQEKLAEIVGVSRGSISFYELGSRTVDIEILYRIAQYFDVSVDYLLGISSHKGNFLPKSEAKSFDTDALSPYSKMQIDEIIEKLLICTKKFEEYHIQHEQRQHMGVGHHLFTELFNRIDAYDAAATYLLQNQKFSSIVYKFREAVSDQSFNFIFELSRWFGV